MSTDDPADVEDLTDLDRFIGLAQAAKKLNMHRDTAWRLNKAGEFPVPVHNVAGKYVVSLRRVVEFVASEPVPEAKAS